MLQLSLPVWYDACDIEPVKAAFSTWDQRIAPVFDTAQNLVIVETSGDHILSHSAHTLPPAGPEHTVMWLVQHNVGMLICGAISRPLQERLTATGIRLMPFVAGELSSVIHAWIDGTLHGAAFTMPGCCGRRRMRRCCAKGLRKKRI